MRVLSLIALVALFGCAHTNDQAMEPTSHETAEAQPPPEATPPPAPQAAAEPTPPPAPQAAAEPTPTPAPQAAAEPTPTPAPQQMASKEKVVPCKPVRVHFAFDSDVIPDEDKQLLDGAAECLSSNQRLRISIEGNADQIGPEVYNQDLGGRRAAAVAAYLQQKGVSSDQLQAILSNGEDKPVCIGSDSDSDCLARNRRTAIRATCHL
jgi:outer membrane protein OmpA-like peptidoglycan-associated protein